MADSFGKARAALGRLNWAHLFIELIVVMVGVFVGTEVSNWNEQRRQEHETERLLQQLRPEMQSGLDFYASAHDYYATTDAYAQTALEAWDGDRGVSDRDFVIAAYQATQIYGQNADGNTWATIFGSDQIRRIDDRPLREALVRVLSYDYDDSDWSQLRTEYRQTVRSTLPEPVQAAIRDSCGDQTDHERRVQTLPRTCDADLSDAQVAGAASVLRSHPEAADQLRWHIAEVATFIFNMEIIERQTRQLLEEIERIDGA